MEWKISLKEDRTGSLFYSKKKKKKTKEQSRFFFTVSILKIMFFITGMTLPVLIRIWFLIIIIKLLYNTQSEWLKPHALWD